MQRKWLFLIAVAVSLVALDQWTKYLVVDALTRRLDNETTLSGKLGAFFSSPGEAGADGLRFRPKRAITVSRNFFRLRYAENPGAAWGLFRSLPEHIRVPMFHVVSLGAVGLIAYYFSKLTGQKSERWAFFGLPLVLGGALGNYVDRLTRGFVVDYLEAHWMDRATWPSFNVADTSIVIGVGLLLLDSFVRKEAPAALPQDTGTARPS
ncbi:MAG: signal peptidase II [Myxococcaceae bacterium]